MKNAYEVLYQREADLARVRREIESLTIVASEAHALEGDCRGPSTVVELYHIPSTGERLKYGGKPFKVVADCLRDSMAVRMGLEDDGPIMSGHNSLAKRLCQVSPYAGRIEPLIGLIPEIMERNDQLRPLWTAWRQNATPDLTPRQYFNRREIKVLCDFVEYLYFASDAFARSARIGR